MVHHTTASGECGKEYHIFAVTEYPIFGLSKKEYVSANIAIPLGPLSVEVGPQRDSLMRRQNEISDRLRGPMLHSSPRRSTCVTASVRAAATRSPSG